MGHVKSASNIAHVIEHFFVMDEAIPNCIRYTFQPDL